MLRPTIEIVETARREGYAVGGFNVYNLEGALAVKQAAEAEKSPALLQIHKVAWQHGGGALVALCQQIAQEANVPMNVHLDHCDDPQIIAQALEVGVGSVMVDGSYLPYTDNVRFTHEQAQHIHALGGSVEAELGRISGTEDNLSVADYEARYTDPAQAADFVHQTQADMLAVCIGNVHGPYPTTPRFDFERLQAIREAVEVPLVLHGTSGVPAPLVIQAIQFGVAKFNVNTEVRRVFIQALQDAEGQELLDTMQAAVAAMVQVIRSRIKLFRSGA